MLPIIKSKKGFTLIELLVVIAILSVLLVIVLVAINPARQTRQARDTERRADVLTILNAVNQYFVDKGEFPDGPYETCPTTDSIGTGGVDIANGGTGQTEGTVPTYIADLPKDPSGGSDADTGYEICQSAADRITVSAPDAEGGATISATR
jgi:prepilin-type N-terminal cleavage/methylation domain-containing protein